MDGPDDDAGGVLASIDDKTLSEYPTYIHT